MFLGKCLREETSGETAGRKEGKGKEERRKGGRTSGETAGRREGKEGRREETSGGTAGRREGKEKEERRKEES